MQPSSLTAALTPQRLHAELLETSVSGAWAYLRGAAHDATVSKRHKTVRFGQSDMSWLEFLRLVLARVGKRAWIPRRSAPDVLGAGDVGPMAHWRLNLLE